MRASSSAPTTTSPSRSIPASCWRACGPSFAEAAPARRPRAIASRSATSVVDAAAHKAQLGGVELALTSFELRVLVVLARRAGETVTREELAAAVLPKGGAYDPSVDRSLDVHVSHLRHKLGESGQKRIRTVRGIGYVLVRPTSP